MARDLEQKKKARPQYPEKAEVLEETKGVSETASDIALDALDKNAISEEKNEPQKEAPQIEEKPLSPSKNDGKKLFLLGLGVFIGTIIFTSGIFMLFVQSWQNVKPESVVVEKKIPPPASVSEPIATPLQREEWELSILNGSGVVGLAKKVASQLEDMGYVIKSTGNASKNNYETTQIFISKNKTASEAAVFLLDMKKELGVATSSSELTGKIDAQIIVGKDNAE